MLTLFDRPSCQKELFFALSNSFQITIPSYKSENHRFAGIYAIYIKDVCYYVGQSQNLASRLSQHLSGKYKDCERVEIYTAKGNGNYGFDSMDKDARKSTLEHNEMEFIRRLEPIENLITTPSSYLFRPAIGFNCLTFDDSFIPCAYVFSRNKEIAVSTKHRLSFLEYRSLSDHNLDLIKYIKKVGVDRAEGMING